MKKKKKTIQRAEKKTTFPDSLHLHCLKHLGLGGSQKLVTSSAFLRLAAGTPGPELPSVSSACAITGSRMGTESGLEPGATSQGLNITPEASVIGFPIEFCSSGNNLCS